MSRGADLPYLKLGRFDSLRSELKRLFCRSTCFAGSSENASSIKKTTLDRDHHRVGSIIRAEF